jgi:spore maturation protein CgeB
MRVLVVDTYYPAFLRAHYANRPGIAERPYEEQHRSLMERSFGTSDAYSHYLRALGHEAMEVVANAEPLQLAWAREHGAARSARAQAKLPGRWGIAARDRLPQRIAAAQVEAFGPDVVYLQDLNFFSRVDLGAFRSAGRLVVGQIASAAPPADVLRGFDLITTSFPHYVERFRALGVDSEYLAIAFDERVLDRLPSAERDVGVSFVGGLDPRVHPGGVALLERLAARLPLELWGYGGDELGPPLRERWRGEAWGLDMYAVLARSRISLNRHIEAAEGNANNMRLFEATGAGSLLVTEAAPNLAELFEPGREVVAYESEDDLVARVGHYLANDDERAAIATAGHRRTLGEHTYARRIAQLAEILQARLQP